MNPPPIPHAETLAYVRVLLPVLFPLVESGKLTGDQRIAFSRLRDTVNGWDRTLPPVAWTEEEKT